MIAVITPPHSMAHHAQQNTRRRIRDRKISKKSPAPPAAGMGGTVENFKRAVFGSHRNGEKSDIGPAKNLLNLRAMLKSDSSCAFFSRNSAA